MFVWDPDPALFHLPGLAFPVRWYSLLFATGFILGFWIVVHRLTLYFHFRPELLPSKITAHKRAVAIADRTLGWVVIATVVGARLGHMLFYETPSFYLAHPWKIFEVWKGGLSSHGGAVAIVLALVWLARRERSWGLSCWTLLDLVAVATPLVGALIRLGNFINQEVLGTPTLLPWGVVFVHPMDGSAPIPRHPVQLYEAAGYLLLFAVMWWCSGRRRWLLGEGRLLGLFLTLTFAFRIVVEHWKEEQSSYFMGIGTMGQWLSVPLVVLGLYFLVRKSKFFPLLP